MPESADEERARALEQEILHGKFYFPAFVPAVASALGEARREENEACAKICDTTAEIFEGEVYADPDPQYNTPEHRQCFVHEMITVAASAIRSRQSDLCHDRPEQVEQSVSAQAPLQTEPDRDAVKEEQEAIKEIIRTVATDQAVDGELYIISAIMKAIDERSYAR